MNKKYIVRLSKTARFSGADYAFAKPFEISNLLTAVHELLGEKRNS